LHAFAARAGPAGATRPFIRLFEAAERDELPGGRLVRALAGYQACTRIGAPASLTALAWSRSARVAAKLGQADVAREALGRLASSFVEESDLFGQPFGLSASLALAEQEDGATRTRRVTQMYEDLAGGRWPVHAEQAAFYLDAIEHLLGRDAASRPPTPFLEAFEVARTLEVRTDLRQPLPAGEAVATNLGGGRFPGFRTGSTGGANVAITLDTAWVDAHVVADLAGDLQLAGTPAGPRARSAGRSGRRRSFTLSDAEHV
jgi:hypothetical protein